ncbi:hypothetical protein D6851_04135 [Altericroceibacterium spongiae]|uniref:Uncharacterized protein n=1 Tax=Altericroceibacterium spongiae TaxID=2320269 RepID=A0A420EP19_9SPHN|nr:hypothetical protein [Altericroceibacterium spongiae]RKF22425.1 hypothetical protein D6851_04135 [Altericroceibacterium spongiae]UBS33747.1 hypothetical protein LBX01_03740 [Altererythrobacter sp. N1]|tara:strand:+ start:237 stop:689 length:453 start_codon:yes stop_codon:yes gene_type:complete
MTDIAELTPITGDIAASADVTINTKGGSVTAILKKSLRDRLGALSDHLAGAALQFASGQSVLLLAGAGSGALAGAVRVRKTGQNRFEIVLDGDEAEEIDEVTATFLRLKKDQFEKGLLNLSEPMTAVDWRKQMDADLADVREVLAEVDQK